MYSGTIPYKQNVNIHHVCVCVFVCLCVPVAYPLCSGIDLGFSGPCGCGFMRSFAMLSSCGLRTGFRAFDVGGDDRQVGNRSAHKTGKGDESNVRFKGGRINQAFILVAVRILAPFCVPYILLPNDAYTLWIVLTCSMILVGKFRFNWIILCRHYATSWPQCVLLHHRAALCFRTTFLILLMNFSSDAFMQFWPWENFLYYKQKRGAHTHKKKTCLAQHVK